MNESPDLVLDGGAPIRQQIEGQIGRLVLSGVLRPGTELPTVREMAVDLEVNPRLVEQAYDRLERMGLMTSAEGCGPRVAVPAGGPADADLKRLCEVFLQEAAGRGHSLAAVLHALQACLGEELSHEQDRRHRRRPGPGARRPRSAACRDIHPQPGPGRADRGGRGRRAGGPGQV